MFIVIFTCINNIDNQQSMHLKTGKIKLSCKWCFLKQFIFKFLLLFFVFV